ncbi:MAG: diaminopimelate decarboxylase [Dehalococcoidia bacterium]|nr:diaminopimelate decarboxylase [Dehalococcoidia bacterium]
MKPSPEIPKLAVFPPSAEVNRDGHLVIAGCDTVDLARRHGTPLYVFDEPALRQKCQEFKAEFSRRYPDSRVIYASKAFLNRAMARLVKEEGLGLDVVSGGELHTAVSVYFPPSRVYFHGNNKARDELEMALDWHVGRVVVDNMHELGLLNELAGKHGIKQDILFRVTPGVDAHTHQHTTTGTVDSKFGFPIATGQAEEALRRGLATANLNPIGLHFHLGSPIYETSVYELGIEITLRFAAAMKKKLGWEPTELSAGGGFAVQYTLDRPAPATGDYAEAICRKLAVTAGALGLKLPRLIVEPGRAIVARAGVALYTVGAVKDIPGIRRYVCVDGGMGDNIRPAIYGARYEALVASKALAMETDTVTIAGKYCESGDILVRDTPLAPVEAGDILAIPVSGAYCIPMSSNYNGIPRPAIVFVKNGNARLVRRRETYDDLLRLDNGRAGA